MAKFALLLEHRKAFEAFECNKKYHIFLGEKITDMAVFKAASRLSDDVNFHQSDLETDKHVPIRDEKTLWRMMIQGKELLI